MSPSGASCENTIRCRPVHRSSSYRIEPGRRSWPGHGEGVWQSCSLLRPASRCRDRRRIRHLPHPPARRPSGPTTWATAPTRATAIQSAGRHTRPTKQTHTLPDTMHRRAGPGKPASDRRPRMQALRARASTIPACHHPRTGITTTHGPGLRTGRWAYCRQPRASHRSAERRIPADPPSTKVRPNIRRIAQRTSRASADSPRHIAVRAPSRQRGKIDGLKPPGRFGSEQPGQKPRPEPIRHRALRHIVVGRCRVHAT